MFSIEVWGFILAVLSFVLGLIPVVFPQDRQAQQYRLIHAFYLAALFLISLLFVYLIYGSHHEIGELRTRVEEKARLSKQAQALYGTLGDYNSSETCRGTVLSVAAFLEKWKSDIPDTYTRARTISERSIDPIKESFVQASAQRDECIRDAAAMKQLLKGLGSQ